MKAAPPIDASNESRRSATERPRFALICFFLRLAAIARETLNHSRMAQKVEVRCYRKEPRLEWVRDIQFVALSFFSSFMTFDRHDTHISNIEVVLVDRL